MSLLRLGEMADPEDLESEVAHAPSANAVVQCPGGSMDLAPSLEAEPARVLGKILMKLPIILDCHGDLKAFSTAEEALNHTEVIDVESGEYNAFDSEGRVLTLGTCPGGRYGNKRVTFTSVEDPPRHEQELRTRLLDFMQRVGISTDPSAGLEALVSSLVAWSRSASGRR